MRALTRLALCSPLALATPALAAAPLPNPCTLLTSAQVAPAVGGKPRSHTQSVIARSRTCTWLGPPLGYSQSQSRLYVMVAPMTKARFIAGYQGQATRVNGVGTVAYEDRVGFAAWKNGISVALDGSYLSVNPAKGIALMRSALTRV